MLPKPVIKEGFFMTTRKINLGLFRLKPDKNKQSGKDEIAQIVGYCIAVAQAKYQVSIYSVSVMSNHLHITLRDDEANLPYFLADVHRNIAQCLNIKQKTTGPVWSVAGRSSQVWLYTKEDLWERVLYVMLNPVRAGLVQHQRHWPGLVTKAKDFLKKKGVKFKIPHYYFKSKGSMPKEAYLVYSIPPGKDFLDPESFVEVLEKELQEREEEIKQERGNKKFLGTRKVLRIDPFSAPLKGSKEGGFNPFVACSDKILRIQCLAFLKNWRIEYRKRYLRWKRGERDIKFPYGTFKLVRESGVRVERKGCKEAQDLLLQLPEFG